MIRLWLLSILIIFFLPSIHVYSAEIVESNEKPLVEKITAAWLIGGGNVLVNSQAQIEKNVSWVKSIIKQKVKPENLYLYYTDGMDPRVDIVVWEKPEDKFLSGIPLALLFNKYREQGEYLKNNEIAGIIESTEKSSIQEGIYNQMADLKKGASLLFIYNGHGSIEIDNINHNSLKLWGDTRLSVEEFYQLLDKVPEQTTTRVIFTQCFSGAFANIIYQGLNTQGALHPKNRCGFFSESAYREAEGCSSGINENDYRDYTTYFFAALSGKTRLGGELSANPDRNNDEAISLRESHLYTLQEGFSNDLSRSTSEVFLENWQPWYLRWSTYPAIEENEYGEIASILIEKMNEQHIAVTEKNVTKHLSELSQKIRSQKNALSAINNKLRKKASEIKKDIIKQWPNLKYVYTIRFAELMKTHYESINNDISNHSDYKNLVKLQNDVLLKEREVLKAERQFTQLEKIRRMMMLSSLKKQFLAIASNTEKKNYKRLVDCEEAVLTLE